MREQRGFTLVEVLIALALTGLVAVLMLSGMQLAGRGLDRIADRAERLESRRSVEDLLRREIAGAVASPLAPDRPALVGAAQSVEFLTLAEDGGAGLYRVDLGIETEGARRMLVLTRRLADAGADRKAQRTVLVPALRDLRIAYFGQIAGEDAPRWQERWDGSRLPPALVRIALDAGDGVTRPPLVVRLWAAPN
jgi:general secretion pathway protein J